MTTPRTHSPHPSLPSSDPEDAPLEVVLTMTRREWQSLLWMLDETTDIVCADALKVITSELARHGIKP